MDFSWLSDIINGLLKFIPRFIIVRATQGGVCWVLGKKIRELKPGWRFVWPFIMDYEVIVTARQTNTLNSQTIETKDGVKVVVKMLIVYSINDIVQAIGRKNWDVDSTVNDVGEAGLVEIINNWDYINLRNNLTGEVKDALTAACKQALKKFGVLVEQCAITNFAQTEVKTIFGFQNQIGVEE